jgi:transcription elongation factor GreB
MSKAFTRETEDEDDDELSPLPAIPAGTKNYITPAGYRRLKDEYMQLLDVERPALVQTVHWAASNGDRSENGDYIYGKNVCARSTAACASSPSGWKIPK